jgi:two-component system LytT family sensor kinase
MNAEVHMQNRWIKYTVVVAGWFFLGFILSLEIYLNNRAASKSGLVDFYEIAVPQFGRALMWALLAPLILQMRKKMPLSAGQWIGGVGFHFVMSFVVMATFYLGRMVAYLLYGGELTGDFWMVAFMSFYGRNIIDMAFYWAVLAFGYAEEIAQRFRNEELKAAQLEARLIETELKALREQLRPHFLFNTMNTIAVLVREQKNDEAVNLIARLSSLLRFSLDNTRVQEVTVRQEMDFLERYIEIQKARFSDRLAVGIGITPEAMEARIPNLLLQPLVENAILHGVVPKSGPGRVEVSGHVLDGNLHLEVRDDGPGLGIAKIYGASGHLSLRSEPGRGVTVQIVLPCRT